MAKRFKTNARELFSRVNIQIENITYYSKNNGLTPRMHKRLLDCFKEMQKIQNKGIALDKFLETYKG